MHILEETDEYLFVRHAVEILGVENQRPELEPGGLWAAGTVRLSWRLRMATEPPTLQIGRAPGALNGSAPLPRDLAGRLAIWRTVWGNRATANHTDLTNVNFREVVLISALLAWETSDEEG
ncbi:MAG: hypothetical protein V4819_16415 [Verrucomicrobiota bacterium]